MTTPTSAQTEPFAPEPQGAPTVPIFGGQHVGEYTCQTCHDTHGSTNPFHLRTELYSQEHGVDKEGLVAIKIADGEYDFRYFCNACHDPGHHGNSMILPTNCAAAGCHLHGHQF